ncbi:MAG: hypothetical protein ACYS0I_07325 [Planctomycetota bacterium]|jgi:hypothetical protein
MELKIKLIMAVFFLVMLSVYSSISLSATQADKFQAEGLTEPVVPKDGEAAVKVTFAHTDYYMHFDPPGVAAYFTPEGIGFSNEWAETKSPENDGGDYGEVGFDRNAVMWIERQSPARKVVRYRGTLVDSEGTVAHTEVESGSPYGEGDWSDEWFYVYPDGVSVRVIKIYTGKTKDAVAFWGKPGYSAFWGVRGTVFETQETFIHGWIPGLQPPDIIETEALTLITMDGQSKRISYKPYPPDRSLFDPANIQMVNLKSKYHPFTIVPENHVEIKPYYGPMEDHENIDKTIFITWPRRAHFEGRYTVGLSHVIKWSWHEKTDNTLVKVYLLGMTDEPTEQQRVDKLVKLARSWQYAPELILEGDGYHYDGYDIKEKAYILTKISSDKKDLYFSLKASPEKPLFNPVFVIKQMDANKSFKLMINDSQVKNYRAGNENENMILWIPLTSIKTTTFELIY